MSPWQKPKCLPFPRQYLLSAKAIGFIALILYFPFLTLTSELEAPAVTSPVSLWSHSAEGSEQGKSRAARGTKKESGVKDWLKLASVKEFSRSITFWLRPVREESTPCGNPLFSLFIKVMMRLTIWGGDGGGGGTASTSHGYTSTIPSVRASPVREWGCLRDPIRLRGGPSSTQSGLSPSATGRTGVASLAWEL